MRANAAAVRVATYRGGPEEWDAFVRQQPGWTHYHLYGWKRVMERVLGHECTYLAARAGTERLVGVLPLTRVRSLLFGDYLVSMPFLNYGGPLGEPEAVRALTAEAVRLTGRGHRSLLQLRGREALPIDLPVSHRKVTVLLDLPPGEPGDLWRRLNAKVRSQVRRPQKEGAMVRFGADQVAPFHEVFARHMRDLGTPAQSRRLFEAIVDEFGDDVLFACVYLAGRPAAVGCGLFWNGAFELGWASSPQEFNRSAPNMLLYWGLMEKAIERGCSVFDFGRCTPGGGTHRFKQQWGGRDEKLWWYHYAAGDVTRVPSREDESYSLAIRAWRHLPLSVANSLGPRIVRLLP